jgi:hypothetical protein
MSAAFKQGLGTSAPLARKTIPYEYSFRFSLTGVRDATLTKTITVSVESSFVAVSIGYGVVPTDSTVTFGVPPPTTAKPSILVAGPGSQFGTLLTTNFGELITSIAQSVEENDALLKGTIGPATAAVLTNGFKLNPRLAERILLGAGKSNVDTPELATMFSSIGVPAGQVQFLYALRDEGTGREFQSQPILNTAGLGNADGNRPFRYFATPISFAPRSTIRMDVIEVSSFKGELHVVLHGYKVLGETGTPTSLTSARSRYARRIRRR